MEHATVRVDNYEIPLIGIAPDETKETCDECKKKFHLQDIEIVGTKFLCGECKGRLV